MWTSTILKVSHLRLVEGHHPKRPFEELIPSPKLLPRRIDFCDTRIENSLARPKLVPPFADEKFQSAYGILFVRPIATRGRFEPRGPSETSLTLGGAIYISEAIKEDEFDPAGKLVLQKIFARGSFAMFP